MSYPPQLYFTIIRISEFNGNGHFELHNSTIRKDLQVGKPDKMAKAIRYYDKGSYRVACEVVQNWRQEMKNRFSAIEVAAEKVTWQA